MRVPASFNDIFQEFGIPNLFQIEYFGIEYGVFRVLSSHYF